MKKMLLCLGIVIAVIVLAGGGIILYFSMDSGGNLKTFSVRYGNKELIGESNEIILAPDVTHVFECKTMFKDEGYSVTVAPAVGADAKFTVDGKPLSFRGVADLTAGFLLTACAKSFTLTIPGSTSLQDILSKVYPGKTVIAPPLTPGKSYFRLLITSGDAQKTVGISFRWEVAT